VAAKGQVVGKGYVHKALPRWKRAGPDCLLIVYQCTQA